MERVARIIQRGLRAVRVYHAAMRGRLTLCAALAVAGLALAGCQSRSSSKAQGQECFASSECGAGLVCDFGVTPHVCAERAPAAVARVFDAAVGPTFDAAPGAPDAAPDAAPPDAAPPDAAPAADAAPLP